MQAIILAAGMGKRLGKLTKDNTKCMVKVNGTTLIERLLGQIDGRKLSRIVIVTGYKGEELKDYVSSLKVKTPVVFVDNPYYETTNNIYSLYLAKDYLSEEDTLLFESDLMVEDSIIDLLIKDERKTLVLVDKYESWMDGTCVRLGDDYTIDSFIPKKSFDYKESDKYYKTVNIYKFSKAFSRTHYVPFLEAYVKALGNNEYYEQVLRVIMHLDDSELKAKRLSGQLWYEIDDIQDLDIAESMFLPDDDEQLYRFEARYGGYWRYPSLIDFCYLVNPYYPPKRLLDEMRASFDTLVTQYPSGMRVNALLAAKTFGIDQGRTVVGNGAAELIKSLLGTFTGTVGFVRPTFEEYPNRYVRERSVSFVPETDDFSYTADDLMAFFAGTGIEALVLINPDNPTGNYLPKADVLRLAAWCGEQGIRLVYDESFSDFADEGGNTLIDDGILAAYPTLVVVKSISKSYGVPGVRLGIAASADTELIAFMRRDVSIWNINSFGEFFLQIAEKYKGDYAKALVGLRESRSELAAALASIDGLRVLPSQANYLMVELTGPMGSRTLAKRLLTERQILIKDLSKKIKRDGRQFIRVAVRTREDNAKLVAALRDMLG